MIARRKMSQNEWETTEIRAWQSWDMSHPFPAQVANDAVVRFAAGRVAGTGAYGVAVARGPPRYGDAGSAADVGAALLWTRSPLSPVRNGDFCGPPGRGGAMMGMGASGIHRPLFSRDESPGGERTLALGGDDLASRSPRPHGLGGGGAAAAACLSLIHI